MKHIKQFESFQENVGAIVQFLSKLDSRDTNIFLRSLETISNKYDIGISDIDGKYVRANLARKSKINHKCITFWLSLDKGLMIATYNEGPIEYKDEPWNRPVDVRNFTMHNRPYSRTKDKHLFENLILNNEWRENYYDYLKITDFALIIDLDNSKKGLKDLRAKRSEEKLPRIDDNFYRYQNKSKWMSKLKRNNLVETYKDYEELQKYLPLMLDLDMKLPKDPYNGKHGLLKNLLKLYTDKSITYSELEQYIKQFF